MTWWGRRRACVFVGAEQELWARLRGLLAVMSMIEKDVLSLSRCLEQCQQRRHVSLLTFTVGTPVPKTDGGVQGGGSAMAYQLDGKYQVHVSTGFARVDGTPVSPDSVVHAANTADVIDVISDASAADGFTIVPKVETGAFQVGVVFDADLGLGVLTQTALFDGEVIGGTIAGVSFTPGEPVLK